MGNGNRGRRRKGRGSRKEWKQDKEENGRKIEGIFACRSRRRKKCLEWEEWGCEIVGKETDNEMEEINMGRGREELEKHEGKHTTLGNYVGYTAIRYTV